MVWMFKLPEPTLARGAEMKYGIKKPHLYYRGGLWFCVQKGKFMHYAGCPCRALKRFNQFEI